jgi:hypothetical protein
MKKKLKVIDIYKQEKSFNMSRKREGDKEEKKMDKLGSKVGGFLTIALVCFVMMRFMQLYLRMMNGYDDKFSTWVRGNHM